MSLFNLKTSESQLKSTNSGISKSSYDKISATRDISDETFDNSAINYKWSVSGNRWWVPSRSYLNIRVKIHQGDNSSIPTTGATLSPGAAACLFQGAELRLNGKTISHIPDNLPQIYAENLRTMKSKAWLDSVGASTNKWSNNRLTDTTIGVRHDDIDNELVFQPPLSIFGIDHALPSGDYELILLPNPSKRYKQAAVESVDQNDIVSIGSTENDVAFSITNMFFYANYVEGKRADDVSYMIDLEETGVQVRNLLGTGTATNHFVVSPSTYSITVAQQSQTAGSNTKYPPTKFIGEGRADRTLAGLRINYAGQTFPSPDWDGTTNFMTQLYTSNAISTGGFYDMGGSETLEAFKNEFGIYSYMSVPKDGTDRSTRLEVFTNHSGNALDVKMMKLMVFYHYRRVAAIKIENGRVTTVTVQDS
jgi:hypothetical protein